MPSVNQHLIAKRLGISQSTVAGALADQPRFRLETRERVHAEASRLGYRPHRFARVMRRGRSGFIGMIQCAGHMQLTAQRSQLVAREVHRNGYQLLSSDAFWFGDEERTACDVMTDACVEGVVLVSPTFSFDVLREVGLPVVTLSGRRQVGTPQVRADIRQGMHDLTRHLIRLGRRRLALLTQWPSGLRNDANCYYVTERMEGFRAAAREAGLDESAAEVCIEEYSDPQSNTYEVGRVSMRKILARSRCPDAVLCSNDEWATGALAACKDAGVGVPGDIAVTGFDNLLASGYGAVPLTTVAQPIEAMAKKAVEILLDLIRRGGDGAPRKVIKMPCEIIVRDSCGREPQPLASGGTQSLDNKERTAS